MPDDPATRLALRQADQARCDFAIIETELEAIHARRACLIGMLGGACLVQALAFLTLALLDLLTGTIEKRSPSHFHRGFAGRLAYRTPGSI